MSLHNFAHLCSHLNNASSHRLAVTSVLNTKLHLSLLLALQNSGYIGGVVLGGPKPPLPHILHRQPTFSGHGAGVESARIENISVASRRLWLGLKYWQSEPVLGKISLISRPKRRVTLKLDSIRLLVQGRQSDNVAGLRSPGESMYFSTDRGIMEARECVEKGIGGLALCRVE